MDLTTERAIGMTEGPIPWSSIAAYAQTFGYDLDDLNQVMRQLDDAYLKHMAKKVGQHDQATPSKPRKNPPRAGRSHARKV
jgi:hypothetical protein